MTEDVPVGGYLHDHNLKSGADGRRTYTYNFDPEKTVMLGKSDKTFRGYVRKNGSVGIRNYLLMLPSVFCANGPMDRLAQDGIGEIPGNREF